MSQPIVQHVKPQSATCLFLPLPPPLELPPGASPFFTPGSRKRGSAFFKMVSQNPFEKSGKSFLERNMSQPIVQHVAPQSATCLFLPLLPPLEPPPGASPFFAPGSRKRGSAFLIMVSNNPFEKSGKSFLERNMSQPIVQHVKPQSATCLFLPLPPPPEPPPGVSPFFAPGSRKRGSAFLKMVSQNPFEKSGKSFLERNMSRPIVQHVKPQSATCLFLPLLQKIKRITCLGHGG